MTPTTTKPVTASATAWGGATAIAAGVVTWAASAGLIPPDLAQPIIDLIGPLVVVASGLFVIWGRMRATQAVTLTGAPKSGAAR